MQDSEKKKFLSQISLILILSAIIGLGMNFSLIKKYFRGEFQRSFISSEEYPSIAFITLAEAEDLFSAGIAVFIDSREAEAFRAGHIMEAISIPFVYEKEREDFKQLSFPHEKTLVVYCDGSECQSSVELAKFLHEKGFKDIKVFFGGWEEWVREGLPISSGK